MMIRLRHILTAIACTVMFCSVASGNGMGTGQTRPESCRFRTADDSTAVSAPDSAILSAIGSKLQEYFKALEREPTEVKCTEADFIIGVCTDSLVRQAVTILTFRHFLDSPIMGDDAVAIHIYDRWIQDGTVKLKNEADLWSARLFAETNRQSLTGCKAPEITLLSPDGTSVTLFGDRAGSHANPEDGPGKYRILYFYDTDCAKCKVESIMLRNMLENDGFSAILYAVYTGKDAGKWERYREQDLHVGSPSVETIHLWDPDMASDMSVKYGVISTPKLFLISPSGTITGRNLDTPALEKLLGAAAGPSGEEYGSDESMQLYGNTFLPLEDSMDCSGVGRIADHICKRTLARGDTLLYKRMTGDLLYYLAGQRKESYKCGTVPFIDRHILSRSDIWNTGDDTLKVVELALLLKRLDSLCPVGKRLPDIRIPVSVIKAGGHGSRQSRTNLKGLKGCAVIFHTEGCPVCRAEIAAAGSLLSEGGMEIRAYGPDGPGKSRLKVRKAVLVDMDRIWSTEPETAETLMRNFDLSGLPFILVTDRQGRVCRKYVSFTGRNAQEKPADDTAAGANVKQ